MVSLQMAVLRRGQWVRTLSRTWAGTQVCLSGKKHRPWKHKRMGGFALQHRGTHFKVTQGMLKIPPARELPFGTCWAFGCFSDFDLSAPNRTIAIDSDFRVDGAKIARTPAEISGLGLRNRKSLATVHRTLKSHSFLLSEKSLRFLWSAMCIAIAKIAAISVH